MNNIDKKVNFNKNGASKIQLSSLYKAFYPEHKNTNLLDISKQLLCQTIFHSSRYYLSDYSNNNLRYQLVKQTQLIAGV